MLVNYPSPISRDRHIVNTFHSALDKEVLVRVPSENKRISQSPFNPPPGAKSMALAKHDELMRDIYRFDDKKEILTWLLSLPRSEIVPFAFHEFLKRVGASHDNPESGEAILGSRFDTVEIDAIRKGLGQFKDTYVAIRADECTAAGTGLWHTGFIVNTRENLKAALDIVRRILASEFSPSVTAFKRRVGLRMDDTPGVLIQPMVLGDCGWAKGMFTTPLHVNAITRFRGDDCLVTLGAGIGGANIEGMTTRLSLLDDGFLKYPSAVSPRPCMSDSTYDAKVFHEGKVIKARDFPSQAIHEAILGYIKRYAEDFVSTLRILLPMISDKHPEPLYLELGFEHPKYPVLLQCADIKLGHVSKPKDKSGVKVLDAPSSFATGSTVLGRGIVTTMDVLYIPVEEYERWVSHAAEWNNSLKDYVLVCDLTYEALQNKLSFAGYSNAGALVFDCNQSGPVMHSIETHFGGAMREAGILVLAGSVSPVFKDKLKPGLNSVAVQVYANDEREEGFMTMHGLRF